MAKKPGSNPKGEFVFFDVIYEDGSQRSNRRVPAELLGGLEKDEPARGFIIEQDREIAEKSGRAPLAIKSIAPRRRQAEEGDEGRLSAPPRFSPRPASARTEPAPCGRSPSGSTPASPRNSPCPPRRAGRHASR